MVANMIELSFKNWTTIHAALQSRFRQWQWLWWFQGCSYSWIRRFVKGPE